MSQQNRVIAVYGSLLIAGLIATGLGGARVGGFLGVMRGWGIAADRVGGSEQEMGQGALLLVANGNPREVAKVESGLRRTPTEEVPPHVMNSTDAVE